VDWRVKQILQEVALLLLLAGLLALFVVPLVGTVIGKAGVVESKWYVPANEVVTEEGVLSVDESWWIEQWNSSPREVSQEEWEQIVVGEKWSEAE
jgi:hypothetical protein